MKGQNAQSSVYGDAYGNRTHVTAVKEQCLSRLTNAPERRGFLVFYELASFPTVMLANQPIGLSSFLELQTTFIGGSSSMKIFGIAPMELVDGLEPPTC